MGLYVVTCKAYELRVPPPESTGYGPTTLPLRCARWPNLLEGTNRMEKLDMTNFGENSLNLSVVIKVTLDSKNVGP